MTLDSPLCPLDTLNLKLWTAKLWTRPPLKGGRTCQCPELTAGVWKNDA